jgi:cytochrome P450
MEPSPTFTPDDLAAPAVIADPYPAYRALRPSSPVRYLRAPADPLIGRAQPLHAWALLRHDDVVAALRDPGTFSSDVSGAFNVVMKLSLLQDDPPRHTHLRRLVNRAFSPRRVTDITPLIRGLAASLLDALGEGPVEVMRGYAIPLPMQVIATLLGIPREAWWTLRSWSDAVISYTSLPQKERQQRLQEMYLYLREVLEDRRRRPTDDLISALVEAEIEGERLTDAEAVGFCILLLIAGNDTTTNLIGNALHLLSERPELWRAAREDRHLIDPILEETLRFASPVQRLLRLTTRAVEVSGVTIGERELVDVFYGAANRDPAAFAEPDTFRIERPAAEHVAFGQGIHFCLGAPLARVEAALTLGAFLDRFEAIEPGSAPPARQRRAIMPFGFDTLPLTLRAG